MRPLLVSVLLFATALAGCSDGGAPQEDVTSLDGELVATAQTGVIRGIIVDPTITPVAGVAVSLSGDQGATETNEAGEFGFSDLEPGTYFLSASKPGWTEVQQSVEVEAGVERPPLVKVQMVPEPGSRPFVVSDSYEAFLSCGFKAANYVFDSYYCDPLGVAGYQGSDDSSHVFETGASQMPQWYQVEVDWEATQPLSQGLVTIQCARADAGNCGPRADGGSRLCNVRGPSPMVCKVGRDGEPPGGGYNLTAVNGGEGFDGVFSVGLYSNCAYSCVPGTVAGLGAVLEQDVQIYTNVFYNYAPPEGWMFLEDGLYAPPS